MLGLRERAGEIKRETVNRERDRDRDRERTLELFRRNEMVSS